MDKQEQDIPDFTPSDPGKPKRPWFGIVVIILVVLAAMGALAVKTGVVPWVSGGTQTAAKAPKYHCPMHPTITSDKPGTCPICGMDLVPIGENGGHSDHGTPKSGVAGLTVVSISPQARQVMGLKLGVVEKQKVAREVRTSARVVANETRLWRVTTKTEGWVDKLFVSYAGQEVKKGDPLLTVYSPALVSAQAEYLTALKGRGTGVIGADALIESARKRLELWDISNEQIDRLARTQKTEKYLTLYAPASGVVVTRDVLAGQKISSGDPLMVIADLSVVWGEADIYQSDLPYVKVGMPLELSLPYWPGKVFDGKVIFVSPTLDPESRTMRARLEIPNPELLLKPGMYGDAKLLYEVGEKLTIPASAVMFGGQHTYAFRDNGDGHLIPTEIKLGVRSDDTYELLGGLNAGDQVVVSANFLVDSESNLKSAMEALAPGVPAGEVGPQAQEISADNYHVILMAYLKIQEALAADDLAKAREAAGSLKDLSLPAANEIASAKDLAEARQQFRLLSGSVIAAAQKYGPPAKMKLSVLNCPMAFDNKGADWVQRTGETANPYFGKAMLGCGEVKQEIKAPANVQPPSQVHPPSHVH